MPVMSALLLFLAAAAGAPEATASGRSEPAPGAHATGSVSVRIVSGARIKMSEAQDSGLPAIQASSIRERDGSLRTARLVEFN
jgi:hypothetical protein